MKKTILKSLSIIVLCLSAQIVIGQVANDECVGAIHIADPNSCGDYTLVSATPSGFGAPSCASAVNGDVWFTFIPQATSITITVNGASQSNSNGTLRAPIIALYRGDCNGTINELRCTSDNLGTNFTEITLNSIFVGARYLIRIDSRTLTGLGSFELCLKNFNQPAAPGSDCPQSALLCDKSSFTVRSVTGAGSNLTELNDATCVNQNGGNIEMNSTWYTWIAQNDGQLEFTLTPLNDGDDLDF